MRATPEPLPLEVLDWVEAARRHPEVRGIAWTGGGARGDVWPGSDIDLYVLWAAERRPELGGTFILGDRFVDVHHLPLGDLRRLEEDPEAFATSGVVDETAGGRPLWDPDGVLAQWVATVAERLADPATRRARAHARLREAAAALHGLPADDPLEARLRVRDAARLGAFAFTVGTGGLLASARRFPERFREWCADAGSPHLARMFFDLSGLPGRHAAVDETVSALRAAIRDILEAHLLRPEDPSTPPWAKAYRSATPDARQEMVRAHPHPVLLAPTVAHGYYDGALLWMRGFYRLRLPDVLRPLPRAQWPEQALRSFHGLGDGTGPANPTDCRRFLDEVARLTGGSQGTG